MNKIKTPTYNHHDMLSFYLTNVKSIIPLSFFLSVGVNWCDVGLKINSKWKNKKRLEKNIHNAKHKLFRWDDNNDDDVYDKLIREKQPGILKLNTKTF